MLDGLHRVLLGLLRLERRVDPFFRGPLDRATREPLARLLDWTIDLGRRDEGLALAEERELPHEAALIDKVIATMRAHLAADFPPGKVERGGNTKTHGLVRAVLTVHDDLPANLRHGILAEPREFPAWVRFAGPGPGVGPDVDDVGTLSIGVKLMAVPGPKLMDDEAFTQDLTGITTPIFTSPDLRANARLQYWSKANTGLWYFLDPRDSHIRELLLQALWNKTQGNPLAVTYYGCVPYALGGAQAMQYRFVPVGAVDQRIAGLPGRPHDDYLRHNLQRSLNVGAAAFDLCVQLQTDAHRMPIEHAGVRWPDRLSPPVPVARLDIPAQRFDAPAQMAFDRVLSLNPWHSLAAHRPLGNQNRARLRIYRELSEYRQRMNGVKHVEPTGDERFE